MKTVCVYCGAAVGRRPEFVGAARAFGTLLVARGLGLVYGGGGVGLMGAVADAVVAAGGHVIGVIPDFLVAQEVAHRGLTDLRVVRTMHERKAAMVELADAFVVLPGGVGTMDEMFEVWAWSTLALHEKPIGLWNFEGYYEGLLTFVDRMVSEGFMTERNRDRLVVEREAEALLRGVARRVPARGRSEK